MFVLVVIGALVIYGVYVTMLYLKEKGNSEKFKALSLSQRQELNKLWFAYKENLFQSQSRENKLATQIKNHQSSCKTLTDMGERMSRTLQKLLSSEQQNEEFKT